jgi:hypothetical protein
VRSAGGLEGSVVGSETDFGEAMKVIIWLQGKKTYLAAGVLAAAAIYIAVDGDVPMAVGLGAIALGLIGVRDNANRKAELMVQTVRDLQAAIVTRNAAPLVSDAEQLAEAFRSGDKAAINSSLEVKS